VMRRKVATVEAMARFLKRCTRADVIG
jgi:hypothetical protein